jgi:FhaA, N-terminal domain/FHA domain
MASIADIEQLLEQIFERSAARLFRTRVQVVQIERRVERAMERSRTGHGARTEVPASYRVRLHPADLADVAPTPADAQALAARLADAALAFARAHGYHLPGRPTVAVLSDASLDRGRVRIDAGTAPGDADAPASASRSGSGAPGRTLASGPVMPAAAPTGPAVPVEPVRPGHAAAAGPDNAAATGPGYAGAADAAGASGGQPRELEPGGIRVDGDRTQVFRRPAPEAARALLRVFGRDGRETAIDVNGRPLTVGRSRDNALVIDDPRVSRHHGRLQARHGTLVYTDLGSTNGSRVNGIRVDEIALGLGDRLLVGDTVLVVETLPD